MLLPRGSVWLRVMLTVGLLKAGMGARSVPRCCSRCRDGAFPASHKKKKSFLKKNQTRIRQTALLPSPAKSALALSSPLIPVLFSTPAPLLARRDYNPERLENHP